MCICVVVFFRMLAEIFCALLCVSVCVCVCVCLCVCALAGGLERNKRNCRGQRTTVTERQRSDRARQPYAITLLRGYDVSEGTTHGRCRASTVRSYATAICCNASQGTTHGRYRASTVRSYATAMCFLTLLRGLSLGYHLVITDTR